MAIEFKELGSYGKFSDSVTTNYRFLLSDEDLAFLETVAYTASSRKHVISRDTLMYRARIGHTVLPSWEDKDPDTGEVHLFEESVIPLNEKGMRPLEKEATEGRANTKGQPAFYCASDRKTAISEVRPWFNSFVSLAEFYFSRDLTVVDCTKNFRGTSFVFKELDHLIHKTTPTAEEKEAMVWHKIDEAFSRPVTRSDKEWEYLPTQILSEHFRKHSFDGILYRSAFHEGANLVVFDTMLPLFQQSYLAHINNIDIDFEISDRFY